MKEWFQNLDGREQRTLAIGAIALVLMLLVFTLTEIHQSNASLALRLEQDRTALTQVQAAAEKIRQLRSTGTRPTTAGGQSLLALADRTAKAAALGSAMKRVQPEGDSGVRIWMEDAPFDDVIKWLELLSSQYGTQVATASFERKETPGRVDARITLEQPKG